MIYRQLLGPEFDRLPPVLRRLHEGTGCTRAAGSATIHRSPGLLPRLAGFPRSAAKIAVVLEVSGAAGGEIWMRRFANSVRRSVQRVEAGFMVEAFGPLRLDFQVAAVDSEIRYTLQRASFLGLPLPLHMQAAERASGAAFEFEVTVTRIGSYHGRMELIA